MFGMDLAGAAVDQAAASQGEQQAAGSDEVSVEAFEQRQESRRQNNVDDPARANCTLKRDGCHEFFAGQIVPRSYICDCGDHHGVENNSDQYCHPYGFEKSGPAKFGSGFFSGFADRLESGHEIGDDLKDEQERNQGCVGEERREVARRTLAYAKSDEDSKQGQRAESGPVLKSRAEADAAIVQRGEQRGESKADDEVRKKDWASGNAVDLERIERWEDVTGDAAYGDGFPRADDEVGEHHHPSGGEADGARKNGRSVGDLARGVWHGGHQPTVDPADREQQRAADGEAE